jgi:hypothetical protein
MYRLQGCDQRWRVVLGPCAAEVAEHADAGASQEKAATVAGVHDDVRVAVAIRRLVAGDGAGEVLDADLREGSARRDRIPQQECWLAVPCDQFTAPFTITGRMTDSGSDARPPELSENGVQLPCTKMLGWVMTMGLDVQKTSTGKQTTLWPAVCAAPIRQRRRPPY